MGTTQRRENQVPEARNDFLFSKKKWWFAFCFFIFDDFFHEKTQGRGRGTTAGTYFAKINDLGFTALQTLVFLNSLPPEVKLRTQKCCRSHLTK